jgi:hypothetical protein
MRGIPLGAYAFNILPTKLLPTTESLLVPGCGIDREGMKVIAGLLERHSCALRELDVSNNDAGPGITADFSNALRSNYSLQSLNLLGSEIGTDDAEELILIKKDKPQLRTLCGLTGQEVALALTKQTPGCMLLLCNETVSLLSLTDLDLAGNSLGPDGAAPVAGLIMRLPQLTRANLLQNKLSKKGAEMICTAAQTRQKSDAQLQTLCGFTHEAETLALAAQKLDSGDAVLIARDLSMEVCASLTHLDVSANSELGVEGATALAVGIGVASKGTKNALNLRKLTFAGAIIDMGGAVDFEGKPLVVLDANVIDLDNKMYTADFGGLDVGEDGSVLIAAFLPRVLYIIIDCIHTAVGEDGSVLIAAFLPRVL